jgi:glycine/D-amino acid oxidase-like deaminating enzyme
MEELRRRMASAKSWGIEGCRLVTPAEIKELVPYVNDDILVGGFYTPSVAVVDSLRFGTVMREQALAKGVRVFANTEVTGIDVEGGRVRRVRTTRGDFEADTVVIACGVWSPRIARMAGASIPLTPAVHQMIDVGPVPRFLTSKTAVEFPIVRDMDTNMYERQDGQGLEVGSYAHRPILYEPDDIPSIEESALTRPNFPSRRRTSSSSSSTRSSSCPRSSATSPSASSTRSTACSRSLRTVCRSSARRRR